MSAWFVLSYTFVFFLAEEGVTFSIAGLPFVDAFPIAEPLKVQVAPSIAGLI